MLSKKVLWKLMFVLVYATALSSTINVIAAEQAPYLPYSEFIHRVQSGDIQTLETDDGRGAWITGTYVKPDGALHSFRTRRPRQLVDDPLLSALLNERGIAVNVVPSKRQCRTPATMFMLYLGRYGYGFAILLALFTLYLVARVNLKITHIERHLFFSRPDSSGEGALSSPKEPRGDA